MRKASYAVCQYDIDMINNNLVGQLCHYKVASNNAVAGKKAADSHNF